MHAKWMRLWGMVAVVLLLAPLMAVAQYGSRETQPYSKSDKSRETQPYSSSDRSRESRGEIEVVNDLREEVSLSMSSEDRKLLGEWSIQPRRKCGLTGPWRTDQGTLQMTKLR